jgi:Xaa-Pro aminopeptidase
VADTVRSAALRHELPPVVVDPFLLVDDDPGRRWVMSSALEAARPAEVRPDVEQVAVTDLGFRELLESGPSRPELLLTPASRMVAARTGDYPPAEGMRFSLGHGVGLEVHEAPGLGQTGRRELVAGDVVAIEPGLWDRAVNGVRFEDLLLVTQDGCEPLTEFPYDLTP